MPLGLAVQPHDLIELAYAALVAMQADTGRLRQCKDPMCGRWFMPDEGRRRYCPSGCADRHHDRKAKQRQRAAEGNAK
jgi:predicted RNA-binding Zn ribbon-like protein